MDDCLNFVMVYEFIVVLVTHIKCSVTLQLFK